MMAGTQKSRSARFCDNPSCVGEPWCSEWQCCKPQTNNDTDFKEPRQKKQKLTLGKEKKVTAERRFGTSSAGELESACKGYTPKNTERCTQWALRVFHAWRKQRNEHSDEKCPDDLLEKPTLSLLNKWLPAFVVEAHREDGKRYPTAMINQLLAGLWQASHSKCPDCPNFMDRKD